MRPPRNHHLCATLRLNGELKGLTCEHRCKPRNASHLPRGQKGKRLTHSLAFNLSAELLQLPRSARYAALHAPRESAANRNHPAFRKQNVGRECATTPQDPVLRLGAIAPAWLSATPPTLAPSQVFPREAHEASFRFACCDP